MMLQVFALYPLEKNGIEHSHECCVGGCLTRTSVMKEEKTELRVCGEKQLLM